VNVMRTHDVVHEDKPSKDLLSAILLEFLYKNFQKFYITNEVFECRLVYIFFHILDPLVRPCVGSQLWHAVQNLKNWKETLKTLHHGDTCCVE